MQYGDTDHGLDQLARLAGRNFATAQELMGTILQLIAVQLGMRSSFITRILPADQRLTILAVHNAPGGCDVPAEAILALTDTF